MRILIVQDTDWLTRNPITQHHLAEMLALRGHEIHVIDHEIQWRTQGRKELYSRRAVFENVSRAYNNVGITVIRPSIMKVPVLDYLSMLLSRRKEINRQIREFNPDVIIGLGIIAAYLGMRAARGKGIPYIQFYIDVSHQMIPQKLFRPLGKAIENVTLRQADVVVINSNKTRDYIVETGAPHDQIRILKSGIDIGRYDPAETGDTLREQYGLAKGDTVILFMGWLYEFAGLKEIASQLALINDPRLKFLVVGEGDIYDDLQRMRDKLNLWDRLVLTGLRPYQEMPSFIAASDICVLPFLNNKITQDIVPIKIYEYMAMGKPVISTRLPGVMAEFGDDNGVVYVDRPEDFIAKAIELTDSKVSSELGTKARTFAEGYRWDTITDEFECIMNEAINMKQTRR